MNKCKTGECNFWPEPFLYFESMNGWTLNGVSFPFSLPLVPLKLDLALVLSTNLPFTYCELALFHTHFIEYTNVHEQVGDSQRFASAWLEIDVPIRIHSGEEEKEEPYKRGSRCSKMPIEGAFRWTSKSILD